MTATGRPAITPPEGALFYVVGAPTHVRERLLREARSELAGDHRVVFAHRYVTRGLAAGRGDEVELPEEEFLARVRHRLLAMHWESGGVRYGVGMEINYWLAVGVSVVVKGSRAYLPQALAAYPEMIVLWIGAGIEERRSDSQCCSREVQLRHAACAADRRRATGLIRLDCNGTGADARNKLVSVLAAGPARA